MAVELKCQSCGAVLTVEAPAGTRVSCPQCKTPLVVPEPSPEAETIPQPVHKVDWRDVFERGLPWLMSVALHGAMLLIMAFVVWATANDIAAARQRITVLSPLYNAEQGGSLHPGPADDSLQPAQNVTEQQDAGASRSDELQDETDLAASQIQGLITVGTTSETASRLASAITGPVTGAAGAGGPVGPFFSVESGGGPGPQSSFFGRGGESRNICFVIDRSGSMTGVFEYVKKEMQRSIRELDDRQLFHVIFFNFGDPIELPHKRMIFATDRNKLQAIHFIDGMVETGKTDPRSAMRRAFALRPQPDRIYFLTDGAFDPDIVDEIARMNVGRKVRINTYAFRTRTAEAQLKQIASQNGGDYTYINPEAQAGVSP